MSFISNSAKGIGGSDPGVSIQQPLVNWGGLEEETCHGTSNSESTSSKRIVGERMLEEVLLASVAGCNLLLPLWIVTHSGHGDPSPFYF